MDSFGVVKYRVGENKINKIKEDILIKNIKEDIDSYKYEYDFLLKEGYTLENYTPKVKEVDNIVINVEEGEVRLYFKPKELSNDEGLVRLFLFLIKNNTNNI